MPKQQIKPRLGGATCVAPDALEALRKQARRIEGVADMQQYVGLPYCPGTAASLKQVQCFFRR
ncbi:hypothetical protein BZA02_11823 [Ruegeria sp. P4]|nr:hypothetical protein BZA02_11823 [Ruegeria sp. P4]